jgi:hypothetical protein
MIVFADLHLEESSEDVAFRALAEIERMALATDGVVACLGDFWHLRYRLPVRLLNRVADLLASWVRANLVVHLLPGNHDQIDVEGQHALDVFRHAGCWVHSFPEISPRVMPGVRAGWVPYRKHEQHAALHGVLQQQPHVVFGHFGMAGAIGNSGQAIVDGLTYPASAPPLVLGHYHRRQGQANWQYVGSPYQRNYGEEGNVCGVLRIDHRLQMDWCALDVGAPTHHTVIWDPAVGPPPPRPGGGHVRLKIRASHEMIIAGKFKETLKTAGLDDVEIIVEPVAQPREHRFVLNQGETLLAAARRYVGERLSAEPKQQERTYAALKGWADAATPNSR